MVVILMLAACEDIFEPDLEDKIVQIIAPEDGLQTVRQTNTFWWEYVEGALEYNLQIVNPSFDYILKLELDTNITENQFTYTLTPGSYQWRVSAFNFSSATPYTMHTLTIIDTTGQSTILELVFDKE